VILDHVTQRPDHLPNTSESTMSIAIVTQQSPPPAGPKMLTYVYAPLPYDHFFARLHGHAWVS